MALFAWAIAAAAAVGALFRRSSKNIHSQLQFATIAGNDGARSIAASRGEGGTCRGGNQ